MVRKDSPAKTFADLRGKKVDMPAGTREHCRLFLQKYCKEDKGINTFFGSIEKSASAKEALDNVARESAGDGDRCREPGISKGNPWAVHRAKFACSATIGGVPAGSGRIQAGGARRKRPWTSFVTACAK